MLRTASWLNRTMVFGAVLLIAGVGRAQVKTEGKVPPKKTSAKESSSHGRTTKSTAHQVATHHAVHSRRRSVRKRRTSWRWRGQQRISPERAEEIQKALIRVHYLQGKPSGKWDFATQSALRKYQTDHNWQSKIVPDSRALISLGLGPDPEHLLNPDSAMTSSPAERPAAPKAVVPASNMPSADSSPASPADPPASDRAPAP